MFAIVFSLSSPFHGLASLSGGVVASYWVRVLSTLEVETMSDDQEMLVEEGENRSSRSRGRGSNRILLYVVGGVAVAGVIALIIWLIVSPLGSQAPSGGSNATDTPTNG